MQLNKLTIFQQKEIINALVFEGLSYEQIQERFDVSPSDIADLLDEKAVKPYNASFKKSEENDVHKNTVLQWCLKFIAISGVSYLLVVLIQSTLGGFENQIVTDSLAYITQPLSKMVNIGLAVTMLVLILHFFFPILTVFMNDKVNTTYLYKTFLDADGKTKLDFLAKIVLALSLLIGLTFSAKAQETPRDCIIKTAYIEIGTVEKGGNNKGARIDQYRSVVLNKTIKNYSDPWCGYFVGYVFKTCNVPTSVKYSPRARDWFQDKSKIVWRKNFQYGITKKKPQKGDLIGYVFNSGAIGHIEILYEWHEDFFYSIGGNTSTAKNVYRDADKSDGVWRKKRPVAMAYIIANHID